MRYDFSAVTPEMLSTLFPILLCDYRPEWADCYAREEAYLKTIFGDSLRRISHIDSTAVPGMYAKPTVDILLELEKNTPLAEYTETLLENGYVVNTPPRDRILYLSGYTPTGFSGQAYHIHVRDPGDYDELYFRDYLCEFPLEAARYAALKKELQVQYRFRRDDYTDAKGEFVLKATAAARKLYGGRYVPKDENDA